MPETRKPSKLRAFARILFQPVLLARIFFILIVTWVGVMLGRANIGVEFNGSELYEKPLFAGIGLTAALIITIVEYATDAISSHKILIATLGMLVGLIMASLIYTTVPDTQIKPEESHMICNILFGYFGIVVAIKHAERFHLSRLKFLLSQTHERPKVLDSSVIIDGRVREMIDLKVIAGAIFVPNFVLTEIQGIADSSEAGRRARGRRGLEVLQGLRENCKSLEVIDKDYSDQREVDQKLVNLCREMDAELVTNDFNLQKIAQLHKLTVLNINEIANALRPTVYIGEILSLTVVREGKEPGQGVGYLEDGTMVVVDDAARELGQELSVIVSSILQTSSGRLVFAKLRDFENSNGHRR